MFQEHAVLGSLAVLASPRIPSDPTETLRIRIFEGGSWEVVFLTVTSSHPDFYDSLCWGSCDVENLGQ